MSRNEADAQTNWAAKEFEFLLFWYVFRIVKCREDAEEIVNDALLRLNQELRNGERIDNCLGFLIVAARRLAIDRARRNKRGQVPLQVDVEDRQPGPAEEAWLKELQERLDSVAELLNRADPSGKRKMPLVFLAYYRDELTLREIEERYHIPISTASDLLNRARAVIRTWYDQ